MKKALKILLYTVLAIMFCLYIAYRVSFIPMNTDGAAMMLYSKDILGGNFFLSDWSLTGLTFLTTDLPFFIIGVAIAGVGIKAFHIAVTLMYIFMAFSALAVSLYGTKKKLFSILIMAAMGLLPNNYALSNAFVHTAVFAFAFLAALFAVRFNETKSKSSLIILGIITMLAVSGDNMALVLITVPILVLCFCRSFEKPVFPAISVLAGTAGGIIIQKLYLFIGKADLNSLPQQDFIDISVLWHNIRTYIDYFFRLINSYFFTKPMFSVKTVIFGIKILIVFFAIYIIYSAVKAVVKDRETDIPTAIFGISLSLITIILWLTTLNANATAGRYIAFLPLALGMAITRCVDFLPVLENKKVYIAVFVLFFGLTCANLVPAGGGLSAYNTYSETAEFLEANGLTNGYSSFWDSSVITGYSGDKVKVRAVVYEDDMFKPHIWFCKKTWYDEPVNFVLIRKQNFIAEEEQHNFNGVFNMRFHGGMHYGITEENIRLALGEPEKILSFKDYSIFVYNPEDIKLDK